MSEGLAGAMWVRCTTAAGGALMAALVVGCDGGLTGGTTGGGGAGDDAGGGGAPPASFVDPRDGVAVRFGDLPGWTREELCGGDLAGCALDTDALYLVVDPDGARCEGALGLASQPPDDDRAWIALPSAAQVPGTHDLAGGRIGTADGPLPSGDIPEGASVEVLAIDDDRIRFRADGVGAPWDGEHDVQRCDTTDAIDGLAWPHIDDPGALQLVISDGASTCSDGERACFDGSGTYYRVFALGPEQLRPGRIDLAQLSGVTCDIGPPLDLQGELEVVRVDRERLVIRLHDVSERADVLEREHVITICP